MSELFLTILFTSLSVAAFVTTLRTAFGWLDSGEIDEGAILWPLYGRFLALMCKSKLDKYEILCKLSEMPLYKPLFVCAPCTAFWFGMIFAVPLSLQNEANAALYFIIPFLTTYFVRK